MIEFIQMLSPGQRIEDYFAREVWVKEPASLGKLKALRIRALRLAYIIFKGILDEQLTLRAMGLVYTTLLTLVPLLAVSFSVLKALGVDTKLVIFLYYFLEPLGTRGVDLSMKIIEFVENVKIGVLGSVGLAMLIYTVLSTVQKLESSLNYVLHVKDTRTFVRRFSNYLSVLLIGPVLVISALGVTASFMSSDVVKKLLSVHVFGILFYSVGRLVPYILICAACTFIYISLPNTKVRYKAALAGGITAGILWQTTGWIFTSFIASSAQYSAIYSGFAVLILFLIWLYWSFLILLVGAKVCFYSQYPFIGLAQRPFVTDVRLKERVAVTVMYLIGYNFYHGRHLWSLPALTERIGLPPEFVKDAVSALTAKGLVLSSGDEPPALVPAKDVGNILLKEVVASVRISETGPYSGERKQFSFPEVDRVIRQMDDAVNTSLEKNTVRDLILSAENGPGPSA